MTIARTLPLLLAPVLPVIAACSSDGRDDAWDGVAAEVTREELPPRVERLVRAVEPGMFECPDRVWPGAGAYYRTGRILFVSRADNKAWLVDGRFLDDEGRPALSVLDASTLDESWSAAFNFGQLDGIRTLGVSLDAAAPSEDLWRDRAVSLALHEGFHFLAGQGAWPVGNPGSRDTSYPEDWRPTFYRNQLVVSLVSELIGDGSVGLGGPAYWLSKYATEFPELKEAIRSTDVKEGSAQYATAVMTALAELGCDASEEALWARVHANVRRFLVSAPYSLGFLSGFLLREQGAPGWEAKVMTGVTPTDLLLSEVTPVVQKENEQLVAEAKRDTDARNAVVAQELEPLVDRMAGEDFYRVVVPAASMAGSFGTTGFYQLVNEPGAPRAIRHLRATFVTGGSSIDVRSWSVLRVRPTPCQTTLNNYVIALPKSAVTSEGATFSSTFPQVTFANLRATERTDEAGLSWLCPE